LDGRANRCARRNCPEGRGVTIANRLLDRLDGVRRSGRGWIARCPAHADRSASLSIAEADDGRVLVHCFAGCDVTDALAAVGLTLADLFPDRVRDDSPEGRRAARAAFRETCWRAALGVLACESAVVLAAANAIARDLLTPDDSARLALAVQRIQSAREVLA
jgi:hypothetical protein